MRRQSAVRQLSPRNICIFCASRLSSNVTSIPTTRAFHVATKRKLNTTWSHNQQVAAAVASTSTPATSAPNGTDVSWTFDPKSALTAAEQREKAYRRQVQAVVEEQQRRAQVEREQGQKELQEAQRREYETKELQGRVAKPGKSTKRSRKYSLENGVGSRLVLLSRSETPNLHLKSSSNVTRSGSKNSPEVHGRNISAAGTEKKATNPQTAKRSRPVVPTKQMPIFASDTRRPEPTKSATAGWGSGAVGIVPPSDSIDEWQEAKSTAEQLSDRFEASTSVNALAARDGPRAFDESQTVDAPQIYQAPTERRRIFHDEPYQATLWNRNQRASDMPTFDESHSQDWKHLRPASHTSVPQDTSQRKERSAIDDADLVDLKFEEYRRRRDARLKRREQTAPSSNTKRLDMTQPEGDSQGRHLQTTLPNQVEEDTVRSIARVKRVQATPRCRLCKQQGHLLQDCPQAICDRCGQQGHPAKFCPELRISSLVRKHEARPYVQVSRMDAPQAHDVDVRQPRVPTKGPATVVAEDDSRTAQFSALMKEPDKTTRSSGREGPVDRHSLRNTKKIGQHGPTVPPDQFKSADETGEDAETIDRRERRARRGFDDETGSLKSTDRRQGKSAGRRDFEEEADDEAQALREERAARKAARKAQERLERASGKARTGGSLSLPEYVSVANLAQALGVKYDRLISRLQKLGYDDVFPGKILNTETSGMIAMEYNFDPVFETSAEEQGVSERDLRPQPEIEDTTLLPARPPVVTIMGHVDHGKTTILDYLRKSSVAAGEAGGITQHIGAFSVPLASSGKTITFLDTPGHAAFMSMRQRGANVTDIVILVVAADDSVKPQTLESIRCAKEAGVPMIVAINKVDKPEADVQSVKQDLSRHGVEIEDFGGDVQVVACSGKTGQGLDELEEAAVTLSEILDHRAQTDGSMEGWVIEATKSRAGIKATVLVRRGTLRAGSLIVAGRTWARVKTLRDERGNDVFEVGPGMPVEVDGWKDQPVAGDEVLQAPTEQKATDVVEYREELYERERMIADMNAINESRRMAQEKRAATANDQQKASFETNDKQEPADTALEATGQLKVPFIIKADVSGSVEAVSAYVPSLTSPLVMPNVISAAVGAITESDIDLAYAAGGHIIAFNLPKNDEMLALAESRGIKVLEQDVIYRVLDQVKEILEAKLPDVVTERVTGEAEIGQVFSISVGNRKTMKIAGCKIRNGVVGRGSRVRVLRGTEKIYNGNVSSLKNVKKDVAEMRKGTECGMGFEAWEAFEAGDLIQTYEEVRERRKL